MDDFALINAWMNAWLDVVLRLRGCMTKKVKRFDTCLMSCRILNIVVIWCTYGTCWLIETADGAHIHSRMCAWCLRLVACCFSLIVTAHCRPAVCASVIVICRWPLSLTLCFASFFLRHSHSYEIRRVNSESSEIPRWQLAHRTSQMQLNK